VILIRGASLTVDLRFQSAAVGEQEARVEVTTLDQRSGRVATIHAVIRANVVAPDMDVLPTAINFGLVPAGHETQRNILVTNGGSYPLRFRVDPSAPASPFEWIGDPPLRWRSVRPGEAATVTVHYRPRATGRHASQVTIESERETAIVPLFGERLPLSVPDLQVIPRQLDFGTVAIGGTSTRQLVLANDSTANLIVHGAHVEGTGSASFSVAGEAAAVVRAGETAVLALGFTPAAGSSGPQLATLVIESNAAAAPGVSVPLTGVTSPVRSAAAWLEPMLGIMMR
jgi:hypothetical protein